MTRADDGRWIERVGYPLVVLLVALVVWIGAVRAFAIPSYLLPPPGAVARRLVDDPGLYVQSTLATLVRVFLGGGIGTALGAAIGVTVGEVPALWRAVSPYLVAARVLPTVALAPLLLVYLGVGFWTGVAFVALMSVFPMAVSTAAGLRATPAAVLDLAESVDASRTRVLLSVRLPYALPDVVAGLRQSATLAVLGAVLAEWVVATEGLGHLILVASENVRPDVLLAALALVFLVGFTLYGAVSALGRRLRWDA